MSTHDKKIIKSCQDSIKLKKVMEEVVCGSKGLDPRTKESNNIERPIVITWGTGAGKTHSFLFGQLKLLESDDQKASTLQLELQKSIFTKLSS